MPTNTPEIVSRHCTVAVRKSVICAEMPHISHLPLSNAVTCDRRSLQANDAPLLLISSSFMDRLMVDFRFARGRWECVQRVHNAKHFRPTLSHERLAFSEELGRSVACCALQSVIVVCPF